MTRGGIFAHRKDPGADTIPGVRPRVPAVLSAYGGSDAVGRLREALRVPIMARDIERKGALLRPPSSSRSDRSRLPQQTDLGKFCHTAHLVVMSTMNISLPDALKSFVDEQVAKRGYATSSEYVRELIRADRERQGLRKLLLEGAASPATARVDESYYSDLRKRVRRSKAR